MESRRIRPGGLDNILDGLNEEEKITISDKELLKLTQINPQLTVVETGEDFDWSTGNGAYYEIAAEKNFDKPAVSYMNDTLDIYQVHLDKLGKLGPAYFLKGGIKLKGAGKRITAKNIKLSDKDGSEIDLGDYEVKQSGRSREFYGFTDQGARDAGLDYGSTFNQTSVSALFKGRENFLVVYRMTFSGSEMIGSRLYVQKLKDGKRYMLDQSKNGSLVLFMNAIDQIHDSEMTETSCEVTDISKKIEENHKKKRYDSLPGYG